MSNKPTPPQCGNWPSAISAELIVSDSININEPLPCVNSLYYIERRPQEKGRCVIVKATDGDTNDSSYDLLPAPYSARSRVHEYGGGCYCIDDNDKESPIIYFINDSDQDIYSIANNKHSNNTCTRITQSPDQRFADFSYDKKFHRLVAIAETHTTDSESKHTTVINSIVSIDLNSGEITTMVAGNDFYASPKLNSTSTQLCWQSWNHPNMPWDGNQLFLASIDDHSQLVNEKIIAGSASYSDSDSKSVATFQPQWSPDDILYFISDESGWWHLYRYLDTSSKATNQQLTYGEKEFGLPQWVFAQSTYAFIDEQTIICSFHADSSVQLATLSLNQASQNNKPILSILENDWLEFSNIRSHNSKICFIAASSTCFPQLVSATFVNHDIANEDESENNTNKKSKLATKVVKTTSHLPVTENYYSTAQAIQFTNRHNQTVFANYYPPTNPDYVGNTEQPPLIVICHGGPTGQSSLALDPKKQFWTSRGFALLDVNYSGSTGYGKNYRLRLNKNWGKRDVEDCCDAALYAVAHNLAHKDQLIIRGSSAGGYTVLAALTFENVFSAGASYYGISELTSLASDTHKFESRYLDRLIGPYPKDKNIYQQRSPINFTEQLNCPVIFFQGIEDRVVPKEQAETMVAALKKKGLPVAAQYFKGEQHGFRKAETIAQSLGNELLFYRKIFDIGESNFDEFLGDIETSNI